MPPAESFFRLDGKVAFVTGGGQGIGEAIARRLGGNVRGEKRLEGGMVFIAELRAAE